MSSRGRNWRGEESAIFWKAKYPTFLGPLQLLSRYLHSFLRCSPPRTTGTAAQFTLERDVCLPPAHCTIPFGTKYDTDSPFSIIMERWFIAKRVVLRTAVNQRITIHRRTSDKSSCCDQMPRHVEQGVVIEFARRSTVGGASGTPPLYCKNHSAPAALQERESKGDGLGEYYLQ